MVSAEHLPPLGVRNWCEPGKGYLCDIQSLKNIHRCSYDSLLGSLLGEDLTGTEDFHQTFPFPSFSFANFAVCLYKPLSLL